MNRTTDISWETATWEGSRRAQLRATLALTVRERLQALEELGELAQRLETMPRTQGRTPNPMNLVLKISIGVLLISAVQFGAASTAAAQDLTVLRVNTFPTASYSPILVGIARGAFEKRGLKIELEFTPNSDAQREGLAKGASDIVHAAVDNAVAMVEMAHEDVVIVTGGDTGMNEFMVRPEIKSIADIRGKNLIVDAPNTAYALVARKILKNAGLIDGRDYTMKPIGGTPLRI
ncbi:MAG TPA: ABC transporter substrate-binding protein [Burkholderiales bacterium]